MSSVNLDRKMRLYAVTCAVSVLQLISVRGESATPVPCYLHPAGDGCHYTLKADSNTCTSSKQRQELSRGIVLVNRTLVSLEQQLIRLGVIPPDNACSELPSVSNGGIVYSDLNLSPGATARYVCDPGYLLETVHGRYEFSCTEDGLWDGEVVEAPVTCLLSPERCQPPDEIENGTISYLDNDTANILVGDIITYTCNPETELHGPTRRFCLKNGNWSDSEPACVAKDAYHTDPVPDNGLKAKIGAGVGSSVFLVVIAVIISVIGVVIYKIRKKGKRPYAGITVSDQPADVTPEGEFPTRTPLLNT